MEIKSVKCTNAKYGFKVLGGSDSWTFYHPSEAKTSISFISNKDTVSYADYAFSNLFQMHYISAAALYSFIYDGGKTLLISENAAFPISQGMILPIPLFAYYWNGHSAGSVSDQGNTASNGSTVKMTITSVSSINFNASFSGKIWSDRQKDTLFISNGEIKNAPLPTKE